MTADRAPSTADRLGAMACSVAPDGDQTCITCSDEALPARVMQVDQETGLALVAIGGHTAEVDIRLVDAVAPGDSLLVHGGVAIARLDER
jgi:hydrogenase assembly chaperone HypC/HupF